MKARGKEREVANNARLSMSVASLDSFSSIPFESCSCSQTERQRETPTLCAAITIYARVPFRPGRGAALYQNGRSRTFKKMQERCGEEGCLFALMNPVIGESD